MVPVLRVVEFMMVMLYTEKQLMKRDAHQKGFTIVELLIVVVVIAILASLVIISYNGISNRSRQASMQANIKQVAEQVMNYHTLNGSYPTTLSQLNSGNGVPTGNDAKYAYTVNNDTFCLSVGSVNSSDTYFMSNTAGSPQAGLCTGHGSILAGFPSHEGYSDLTGV